MDKGTRTLSGNEQNKRWNFGKESKKELIKNSDKRHELCGSSLET